MNAWILDIEKADAQGELKQVYDEIEVKRGNVSNVTKAQSLDPKSIKLHLDLYFPDEPLLVLGSEWEIDYQIFTSSLLFFQ
jgi:hypothetical protein